MGNGLSQNEIDALLAGVDESSMSPSMGGGENSFQDMGGSGEQRNKKEMEDLNEFLNEALTSGLNVLTRVMETELSLSSIKTTLKDSDKIVNTLKGKTVVVSQNLKGALNGEIALIFEDQGALKLIEKMLDQEQTVLSEIALDTFGENLNQFFSAMHTWIKGTYKQDVNGDIPKVKVMDNPIDIELSSKQSMQVDFFLRLGNTDIPVIMVLPVTLSKEMLNISLLGTKGAANLEDAGGFTEKSSKGKQVNARPVQFSRLDQLNNRSPLGNIEILLDVTMQVTVELGRTKMRIREILGLGEGSIIELQKLAGEPVDILVNAKPIAKGEVVVIDEYFGVRITEIMSPHEMMDVMNMKEDN